MLGKDLDFLDHIKVNNGRVRLKQSVVTYHHYLSFGVRNGGLKIGSFVTMLYQVSDIPNGET